MDAKPLGWPQGRPEEFTEAFSSALLAMDRRTSEALAHGLLERSRDLGVLEAVLVQSLELVGQAWEEGRCSLSQVYMAGRICEGIMDSMLGPPETDSATRPDLACVTLEDFHGLGRRMILSALRAAGFSPVDYGRLGSEALLAKVRQDRPRLLMISVLMLPSALKVRDLVQAWQAEGLETRVVVGGAPFRLAPMLAAQVGADAVGSNSTSAVSLARRLLEVQP